MIKFDNWQDVEQETEKEPYKLPKKVESIGVSHDGGRLEISINGETVFYKCWGTGDCSVEISNKGSE